MISIEDRLKDDAQALRKLFDRFSAGLHVAAPGIIQTFNADTQTVTVELAIKERVTLDGDDNNTRTTEDKTLPILLDVPIVIPRAGGYIVTMPIQAGDECLVIFADTCIDSWFQSGFTQSQMFKRRHSISDGFAILGTWSQPRKISEYSTDSMQIRNDAGDSLVEVKDGVVNVLTDAVNLSNAATVYKLVDERLVTWLNSLTLPVSGSVTGPVTVPLVLADVATAKTKAG